MADIIKVIWCPICHKYLGHFNIETELETKNISCSCGTIIPLIA
jgi:hypothetical protein